jgi:nucleoside-diphosphate-sugar epimerase
MSLDEPWYGNRFAFDVFKAAIIELISSHQPSSDAPGTVARLEAVYGPGEKPETIGRILARVFISRRGHDVEPTIMDHDLDEYEG